MGLSCMSLTAVGVLCLLCSISASKFYTCFTQKGGAALSSTCDDIAANSNFAGPFYCYHTACMINKGPMDPGCSLTLFDANGCPIIGTSSTPSPWYPFSTVYENTYDYQGSMYTNYKVGFQTDNVAGERAVDIYPTSMPSPAPIAAPVPQPTYRPTAAPTSQPSSSPSSSPSTRPTVWPTSTPSAGPSSSPSAAPSGEPTSRPSSVPTVKPTAPTFAPTTKPTVLPTVSPTVAPSAAPTVVPTARPTLEFQSRYVVTLSVKQVVSFLNVTDYAMHQVSYNKTIQNTVASCVSGALASDVIDIDVQSNNGRGMRSLVSAPGPTSSLLSYKVSVRDPLILISMVAAELEEAVSSGAMDAYLHQHAAQQGIEHLGNATFATPQVSSASTGRDSSERLTGTQIALLVICVVLAVGLMATIVAFATHHSKI